MLYKISSLERAVSWRIASTVHIFAINKHFYMNMLWNNECFNIPLTRFVKLKYLLKISNHVERDF